MVPVIMHKSNKELVTVSVPGNRQAGIEHKSNKEHKTHEMTQNLIILGTSEVLLYRQLNGVAW